MNDVERWLRRQAAREQRGVLLEEALLGGRLCSYTRYRLRYFFAKYLVETAVHTVTVLFLFRQLGWHNFLPIVFAFAGASLAANFWWGALEGLRTIVRDLHRSGRPHHIPRVIGGWMVFAGLLGGAVLLLAVGWTGWHLVAGRFGAAEAYIAVLLLRLAVDLPTRCYHSGVYALRRIYKPLPAVLGSELLELAIILSLGPLIGLWALVVASLVLTATLTGVTLRYTGKVYHFIGFAPLAEISLRRFRSALRGAGRESLRAGGANAVIALDSLVVLALLYSAAVDSQALVVLFLAGPSIRAGADWARLFYFDLKRLELRLFSNLRRRFERHTARLAWLLGVGFWALAAGITTAFYGRGMGTPYLSLLAFFLARSLLARVQIQAFAEGAYTPVLGTGLLLLAGLGVATVLIDGEDALLAAVALATAVAAGALTLLRRAAHQRGDPGAALLTLEWLARLGAIHEPVRIGSARALPASGPDRLDARTREEQLRWRPAQLAERTARQLGSAGAAAWIGPDRLVWFQTSGQPPLVTGHWLQVASGGLVADVMERSCAGGEEALLVAGQDALLGAASGHLLTAVLPVDVVAARRRFAEVLPGGAVYAPDEPVPAALAQLPGPTLRAILVDAVAFARDLHVGRRRSRYDVSALCAGGELQLIFVAELRADKRARSRWRHHTTRLNVRAAIGGARAARIRSAWLDSWIRRVTPPRLRRHRTPARIAALQRVPLLSALTPDELERVAAAMTERTFAAGQAITTEGETGVGFFIVDQGIATVTIRGAEVAQLGPGDHFGELALIAETPRLATVTAVTELHCYRMASWEFRKLIERSAAISWHVLQSTARLLHERRRQELPGAAAEDKIDAALTAGS